MKPIFGTIAVAMIGGATLAAPPEWPLLAMRHMSATTFDTNDMERILAIHARHPGASDSVWFAEGAPRRPGAREGRAELIGRYAAKCRAAGLVPEFQQGVTLGHDFTRTNAESAVFPPDAFQVGVDGKRKGYFCPRSPAVLSNEEAQAECYVRHGKVKAFWLDDDLRLGIYKGTAAGCWCDRCVAALNAKTGQHFDRAGWLAKLNASTTNEPLRKAWTDFRGESAALFAAAARRGVKRADPDCRLGYQAVTSASFSTGFDNRAVLEALSDGFRETVGIRPGHGFYYERDMLTELPHKLLDVSREAERCRLYPGWKGAVTYEQENYPHCVSFKTAEGAAKEVALAFAVGCDTASLYWYSSAIKEPLSYYEEYLALLAAWRPYYERLAAIAPGTRLAGVALRPEPNLETGRRNTPEALARNDFPLRQKKEIPLMLLGVPVTTEAGAVRAWVNASEVPEYGSVQRRTELLDRFDRGSDGPLAVRVDKTHPFFVFARTDRTTGRTVAVTFCNAAMGTAFALPVRLRRPQGAVLKLVRPGRPDVALTTKPGAGDERQFVLPDLAPWEVCTVFTE